MRVPRFLRATVLLAMPVMAFSQSPGKPAVTPDAQATFALMKTLAGNWRGSVTTDSPAWATDKPLPLSIRLASHGNALIHELDTGGPEVTVFYVEGEHLGLVHYCDFGNRPHMIARPLAGGNVVEFDLVDDPGSEQIGHVSHGVFTVVDANHHVEDWTFLPTGGKPVHAHLVFTRVQ